MQKRIPWQQMTCFRCRTAYQQYSAIGAFAFGILLLSGCGAGSITLPAGHALQEALVVTPWQVELMPGAQQQFITSQTRGVVTWQMADKGAGGTITSTGLYTAPARVTETTRITITASTTDAADSSASITVSPCSAALAPALESMRTGATQQFAITGCFTTGEWSVNGVALGNVTVGTISSQGLYQAPRIDPGIRITIGYVQGSSTNVPISETFPVTNLALPPYAGADYATTLASWNASLLPWVERLSGLDWDASSRRWLEHTEWSAGANGIAPNVYYLEEAIRPITRMAVTHGDFQLIDELAAFHMALLQYRTTSVGNLLSSAPSDSIVFIDGSASDRTFAWYEPQGAHKVRIRDCQTCNAQYLSTAARLLRAIAELPPASRTPTMLRFSKSYSGFLVSEQLLRLLYGTTPWSHWDNPVIPQPVVAAWTFLSATGYRPGSPHRFQAALTDIELWLIADAADTLGVPGIF